MFKDIFVTGTDTEIGKTYTTLVIIEALKKTGKCVAGMKPVASGCENTDEGLRNEDALMISHQASIKQDYKLVNPYAFAPPVAPHFAAAESGIRIHPEQILEAYRELKKSADCVVVEGVGGWCVPLNEQSMLSELVSILDLTVILVVGLKLGCINHALLSARTIQSDGLVLSGWIANQIDNDYSTTRETLEYLKIAIHAPFIGHLEYQRHPDIKQLANRLDITPFL